MLEKREGNIIVGVPEKIEKNFINTATTYDSWRREIAVNKLTADKKYKHGNPVILVIDRFNGINKDVLEIELNLPISKKRKQEISSFKPR